MPKISFAHSSGFTMKRNLREPELGLPPCTALSIGTGDAFGQAVQWAKVPPFTSRFRPPDRERRYDPEFLIRELAAELWPGPGVLVLFGPEPLRRTVSVELSRPWQSRTPARARDRNSQK